MIHFILFSFLINCQGFPAVVFITLVFLLWFLSISSSQENVMTNPEHYFSCFHSFVSFQIFTIKILSWKFRNNYYSTFTHLLWLLTFFVLFFSGSQKKSNAKLHLLSLLKCITMDDVSSKYAWIIFLIKIAWNFPYLWKFSELSVINCIKLNCVVLYRIFVLLVFQFLPFFLSCANIINICCSAKKKKSHHLVTYT